MSQAGTGAAPSGSLEDLYASDAFRMESMKVVPCSKHYVHDWTECPFAHPHEKARRRDPRKHQYTGIACPSMRQEGTCSLADNCPYSHNVFEYWLHPTRYRTQLCNDGARCHRKICFFAHSSAQLRVPEAKPFVPAEAVVAAAAAAAAAAGHGAADATAPGSALPSPQHAAPLAAAPPQAAGGGGSAAEHPLVELMTRLVARGKVTPERSAAILQQVLPPDALQGLQAQLGGEVEPERVCSSDPLSWARHLAPSSSPAAAPSAAAMLRASADAGAAWGLAPPAGLPDAPAAGAAPSSGLPSSAGPSVAEMRLALLQGALQEVQQARAGLAQPDSARSSLDTVRASFDAVPMHLGGSLDATPRPSWDASCASLVHQQLALGALAQQQAAVAAALAAAGQQPAGWGLGGAADRASLDSQFSQLSLQGSQRTSLESLMSLGGRGSMDRAYSGEAQLSPHRALLPQQALPPLGAQPPVDAFASSFYDTAAAQRSPTQPPAGSPQQDASPTLLHPRPRRSF